MASSVNIPRTDTEAVRYRWPAIQVKVWQLVMTIASATILAVFAGFITVQTQLQVGIPWLLPYWITTASVALAFIIMMLYLTVVRQLLPGIVVIICFIQSILWGAGFIGTTLELWVLNGGVNKHCRLSVNANSQTGKSVQTYAWLEQRSICQCWIVVWVFGGVGTGLLIWMQILAYLVYAASF